MQISYDWPVRVDQAEFMPDRCPFHGKHGVI
jgi:hypothetical protein